jgi:hypothetical protein
VGIRSPVTNYPPPLARSADADTRKRYFSSTFHTLDALVILASFTVDVVLHGVLEEVASLVVILRLWRFFKIIEEFSVGASEQMAALSERIGELEAENRDLKAEMERGGWKGK